MKKRKGFTLAELLAVIVILGIITSITVPIVTDQIDKNKTKLCITQYDNILNAARSYGADHLLELEDGKTITLKTLDDNGYIDISNLKDPVTGEKISSDLKIVIVKENKKYKYYLDQNVNIGCKDEFLRINNSSSSSGDKDTSTVVYANRTEVYYNPETGKKCNKEEANSTTGTKSGCMKWYVFNDKEGNATVNVILDHNTTARVAYNSTGSNSEMKEVKTALENDTSTWKNTARLITANEVAKITNNTEFDASKENQSWFCLDTNKSDNANYCAKEKGTSKYAWLFDYTYECTNYGCNTSDSSTYGYWTSTPYKDNNSYVWTVRRHGNLDSIYGVGSTDFGIRPVITISKSNIS